MEEVFLNIKLNGINKKKFDAKNIYRTTSTAPARTRGSLPVTETEAVKEPSMLNTTHSVFGGRTAKYKSTKEWSPLKYRKKRGKIIGNGTGSERNS